jgi:hypothetical protein
MVTWRLYAIGRKRCSGCTTESLFEWVVRTTFRAGISGRLSTIAAELLAQQIFRPAFRAAHFPPSGAAGRPFDDGRSLARSAAFGNPEINLDCSQSTGRGRLRLRAGRIGQISDMPRKLLEISDLFAERFLSNQRKRAGRVWNAAETVAL